MVEAAETISLVRNLVLRLESKSGVQFISVHGHQIESSRNEPDLKNAEKLTLKESDENIARMKPVEPMKPMEPMVTSDRSSSSLRRGAGRAVSVDQAR